MLLLGVYWIFFLYLSGVIGEVFIPRRVELFLTEYFQNFPRHEMIDFDEMQRFVEKQ